MVTLSAPNAQDYVALAEIELCGELMIAASAAGEERLSPDRIDEVLNVGDETPGDGDRAPQGADAGDRTSQEAGAPQEAGDGGLNATLAADACTTVPRQAANRQAATHRQAAHQR
ncbi:hypothetical protein AB0387_33790 [Streptomyces sp. NPDC089173]|uniref:hypothetical protein n=1 Tax=Streptomyces sp. NPDC089173 TaxID=3154965 RepID=UPI00344DFDB5